jgi:hypothetical protein
LATVEGDTREATKTAPCTLSKMLLYSYVLVYLGTLTKSSWVFTPDILPSKAFAKSHLLIGYCGIAQTWNGTFSSIREHTTRFRSLPYTKLARLPNASPSNRTVLTTELSAWTLRQLNSHTTVPGLSSFLTRGTISANALRYPPVILNPAREHSAACLQLFGVVCEYPIRAMSSLRRQ